MWVWLILLWLSLITAVFVAVRVKALSLWREPVFTRPILVIESDDWGAGPRVQAEALKRVLHILCRYRDSEGRAPVFTLGLVLATADGRKRGAANEYQEIELSDPYFDPLLEVIRNGVAKGVFALQLHGMEHYYPPLLTEVASTDDAIEEWLRKSPECGTEALPPPLQSRWIDASVLPSSDMDPEYVEKATAKEVRCFEELFGVRPYVVVPPTFIWNEHVESAWHSRGVRAIVTPGRRFEARDGQGQPLAAAGEILNGDRGPRGMLRIVRDDYFEPIRGHRAERGTEALMRKTALGRPALLETHRINFIDDAHAEAAFHELNALYLEATEKFPDIAFLSTEDLARAMERSDPNWVEPHWYRRFSPWVQRLLEDTGIRRLLWASGAILPLFLSARITRSLSNS